MDWSDQKVKLIFVSFRARPEGLKRMAKEILDVDLIKSFKVRCGNWETEELSESQVS